MAFDIFTALTGDASRYEELKVIKPPEPGTLRYEAQDPRDLPIAPLNRVLLFSKKHATGYNGFATQLDISKNAEAFFQRIGDCKSEQEARNCIVRFKEELEGMIMESDIPDEYKYKFQRALNPTDSKTMLRAIAIVVALLMLAYVDAVPTSFLGIVMMWIGLFEMADHCFPDKPTFLTENGAGANPNAFRALVAELNTLVTQTEHSLQKASTLHLSKQKPK